jgi:hypothetical protein
MSYSRAVWSSLTWQKVLVTQAAGQLDVLIRAIEGGRWGTWMGHPGLHNVTTGVTALLLLLLALVVDESMARGVAPRRAYPMAILMTFVLACAASALTYWCFQVGFHLPGPANNMQRYGFIGNGIDTGATGAFVMLVYLNRRTVERMLEVVRGAELRRVQLERQLIESRLAATEAQIDPQMLFGKLADIRNGLEKAATDADTKLGDLVQMLRRALAVTVAAAEVEPSRT